MLVTLILAASIGQFTGQLKHGPPIYTLVGPLGNQQLVRFPLPTLVDQRGVVIMYDIGFRGSAISVLSIAPPPSTLVASAIRPGKAAGIGARSRNRAAKRPATVG